MVKLWPMLSHSLFFFSQSLFFSQKRSKAWESVTAMETSKVVMAKKLYFLLDLSLPEILLIQQLQLPTGHTACKVSKYGVCSTPYFLYLD